MTANNANEHTVGETTTPKKSDARKDWIMFISAALIIGAVIVIPALAAGASPGAAILAGLVGGIIGSLVGSVLSRLYI